MAERKVADVNLLKRLVEEGLSLHYKQTCYAFKPKIEESNKLPIWRAHVVTPEGTCYAGIEAPAPLDAVAWGVDAVKVILANYQGKKDRRDAARKS